MAYHDARIEEHRLKRDEIMGEVTDAAGESSKIPRLQNVLQDFDENFDVIGLINFNWGHLRNKPLSIDDRYLRERRIPQSRSTIIKNKHSIRYLAGQEGDVPSVWYGTEDHSATSEYDIKRPGYVPSPQGCPSAMATLVGTKSLIDFGLRYNVRETYFRADWFCKCNHDRLEDRRAIQKQAVDRANSTNDGPIVPVLEHERRTYMRPSPRTKAQISADLVTGSSTHCPDPHSVPCHLMKEESP